MNETMEKRIIGLKMGEVQSREGLHLFPILEEEQTGPEYITMSDAFMDEKIIIKEVNESGSVPELFVQNLGGVAILILDGEELMGAKQNRVLNTSILLAPHSEIKIPVSCSESGRWHYTSPEFKDSDIMMERKIRNKRMASVSQSVQESGDFRSNQREVWDEINKLHAQSGVYNSDTSAMKDAYEHHKGNFANWMETFPCVYGQCGMMVFKGGAFLGMDYISRTQAFGKLHKRLLQSYVLDMLNRADKTIHPAPISEEIVSLLEELTKSKESSQPSVGLGADYRFKHEKYHGAALVHEDTPIHTAFFQLEKTVSPEPRLQSFNARRRRIQ